MENKHEESTSSDQEEKVPVTFTYEGECTIQMTAKELSLFRQLIQQSEDEDVYDSMSMDELIDRFLDDNIDGIFEFWIRRIELKNQAVENLTRK